MQQEGKERANPKRQWRKAPKSTAPNANKKQVVPKKKGNQSQSPPREQNKCPLSAECVLLTCTMEHPSCRTKPCTFSHPGPECQSRCSFLHPEDNNEYYLRIQKRLQGSEGRMKEMLKKALLHLSQEIRAIARKRGTLRRCLPYSLEAKQEIHNIREMKWAMEEFGRSLMRLLDRYDASPLNRDSTLSAMHREMTYYRPDKEEPYWLVYNERRELLNSVENYQVTILSAVEGAGKTSQVPLFLYEREAGVPIFCAQQSGDCALIDANRIAANYASSLSKKTKQAVVVGYLSKPEDVSAHQEEILFSSEKVLFTLLSDDSPSSRAWRERDPVIVVDDALPLTKNRVKLYQLVQEALRVYPRMRLVLMTGECDTTPLQRVFMPTSVAPLVIVPQN